MIRHGMNMYIVACDCDGCQNILPGELSMQDARKARRRNGWEIRKTDNGWKDVCRECLLSERYGVVPAQKARQGGEARYG